MIRVFISLTYMLALLLGTPTNLLSLLYFSRTWHLASSLLHSLMNLTDLVICLLVSLLPAATNIITADITSVNLEPICYVWYILQMLAFRFSVFLIGVVSVMRTYSIVRPLTLGLKLKYLAIILLSYIVYLLGKFTLFALNDLKPGYDIPMRICGINATPNTTPAHIYAWIISDFVETLVPMIVIVVSCTITVLHLKRTGINHNSARKRKATITVVILTVVCILFNLPYAVDRFIVIINRISKGEISPYEKLYYQDPATYFGIKSTIVSLQFMGTISSVINPIVIIIRVNMLHKFREGKRKPYQIKHCQTRNILTTTL